tara:strand:+ start:1491 stop:1757 length:267 start_codon:yes stop_codon:yes gene_type:complete
MVKKILGCKEMKDAVLGLIQTRISELTFDSDIERGKMRDAAMKKGNWIIADEHAQIVIKYSRDIDVLTEMMNKLDKELICGPTFGGGS